MSLMSSCVWNLYMWLFSKPIVYNTCAPLWARVPVTNTGLFRKGFMLTLTQISCRPAKHRANHRQREREEKKPHPSLVAFHFLLVIICRAFHLPAFRLTSFSRIGSIAHCLRSVFTLLLFKDKIDLQNESQSLSAHCSGRTFLCVWIGWPCIASI